MKTVIISSGKIEYVNEEEFEIEKKKLQEKRDKFKKSHPDFEDDYINEVDGSSILYPQTFYVKTNNKNIVNKSLHVYEMRGGTDPSDPFSSIATIGVKRQIGGYIKITPELFDEQKKDCILRLYKQMADTIIKTMELYEHDIVVVTI